VKILSTGMLLGAFLVEPQSEVMVVVIEIGNNLDIP
jgi:hypothetical protein